MLTPPEHFPPPLKVTDTSRESLLPTGGVANENSLGGSFPAFWSPRQDRKKSEIYKNERHSQSHGYQFWAPFSSPLEVYFCPIP